jgi:hypothetical protein
MRALSVKDSWEISWATVGQWELVKWVAAAFMVADHVNSFLLGGRYAWAHVLGRAVFPIFAWIVAAGFARGGVDRVRRSVLRMALVGLVVSPLFWWLRGDHAGNVLLLFASAGWLVMCWELKLTSNIKLLTSDVLVRALLSVPALLLANYCEFGWPGLVVVLVGVAAWRRGSASWCVAYAAAVALLEVVNGSSWALLGVALLVCARWLPLSVPRLRGVFFGWYAGHLALVGLARAVL